MPSLGGLETNPHLRATSPGCRIVVQSAFDSHQVAEEALARGATAYVDKTAAVAELGNVLAGLCEPESEPSRNAGELVSLLVHELQNPITVIQGLASTLRSSMDRMDPDAVRTSLDAIERNARNLSALVRNLGDTDALETGRLRLVRERTDVGVLVREALRDLDVLTGGHPVEAEVDDAIAEVDPLRLAQIVANLLSNAVKFSPPGTSIGVRLLALPGTVELVVEDQGAGVPADRTGELFGKFSRLGTTTKGTGIGLFISRGIARAHGGDLVHEHRPGGGARFRLTLPR
jgi:signal transduction histidine kinase